MLIARATNGMMILGIDAENVKRLKEGKPILKSLAQFGGKDDVLIVYGDTPSSCERDSSSDRERRRFDGDVQRELERALGPLPKAQAHPRLDD